MDFDTIMLAIAILATIINVLSLIIRHRNKPDTDEEIEYSVKVTMGTEKEKAIRHAQYPSRQDKYNNLLKMLPNHEEFVIPDNLPFKIEYKIEQYGYRHGTFRFMVVNGFDCYLDKKLPIGPELILYYPELIEKITTKLGLEAYEAYKNGDLSNYKERKGHTARIIPNDWDAYMDQGGKAKGTNYAMVRKDGYYQYSELRHRQEKGELPLVPLDEVIFDD